MLKQFLLPTLLLASTMSNPIECDLTQHKDNSLWDNTNVAINIDSYWLESPLEAVRRKYIANFVGNIYQGNESFLEIGSGSGLIYKEIVPRFISNDKYTGIDSSKNMLAISRMRYLKGDFRKDDLFNLTLNDNSFDVVAAFEVFGHLPSIEKPVSEMFRVAKRMVVFTLWTAEKTNCTYEHIEDTTFVHYAYSQSDVMDIIARNLDGQNYSVAVVSLPDGISGYLIFKQ
ncbi:MAG: class I SAM-dependent methyltransferase [Parachlamydiales bacterium]|jgi:ubiquinone/menaquinone biosynthesis C-methylase UbiE